MNVSCNERQTLFHHDRQQQQSRRHSNNGTVRHNCSSFTEYCHIQCRPTQSRTTGSITMLMLLPLMCTIICLSTLNSQRTIDVVVLWQSQMLLRSTTDQIPFSSPSSPVERTIPASGNERRLQLRYNYTNLQRYTPLANDIARIQSNKHCTANSTTTGYFWYRNRYGLGSDLHVYSVAICNALQMNYYSNSTESIYVQTLLPWIWYDQQSCGNLHDPQSAMTCYFPESEPSCRPITNSLPLPPPPQQQKASLNLTRPHGKIKESCPDVIQNNGGIRAIRTATTEFLFTRISALVQEEGERQLNQVFANRTTTTSVPHNLITVHIRWGDKADEMELVPITKYIGAVYQILDQRRGNQVDSSGGVHIYVATEDPEALRQFRAIAPDEWNIYVDQYHTELLSHRKESTVYNGIPQMARELSGRPGLIALGSLLVAMEANDYIFTTSSNWSRLMNEIRISIINPRCRNCTTMIDLNPGEW